MTGDHHILVKGKHLPMFFLPPHGIPVETSPRRLIRRDQDPELEMGQLEPVIPELIEAGRNPCNEELPRINTGNSPGDSMGDSMHSPSA